MSQSANVQLREAYIRGLAAAWERAGRLHPGQEPYAFVLYGVEDGPRFTAHVLTEQSLSQVAQRYMAKGHYETLEEARKGLRYSVPDSPHFDDLVEELRPVEALIEAQFRGLDETTGYRILAEVVIQALKTLDSRGLFGTGRQREQLLLVIITEDTEEDWSNVSARRLNPVAVYKRFEAETRVEVEGSFATCWRLAAGRDGVSLYASRSRKVPHVSGTREVQDVTELVALDSRTRELRRRWAVTTEGPLTALVCAPDGKSIYGLSGVRTDDGPQAVLRQWAAASGELLQQRMQEGHPQSLAIAPDGSFLAASIFGRRIHVFTSDLQLVGAHETPALPRQLALPDRGGVLAACGESLLWMDVSTGEVRANVGIPSLNLSLDDRETLLAIAPWTNLETLRQEGGDGPGVQLLRFPSLEDVRTLSVPGHRMGRAVLSPDGRVVVCEASDHSASRTFLIAFDTATGEEIARREVSSAYDMLLLKDGRTLAIGISGTVTAEPIVLWEPVANGPHNPRH